LEVVVQAAQIKL